MVKSLRNIQILVVCCILLTGISVRSDALDGLISKDELIADTRQIAELIESAHPQPYFVGGGKLAFHERFQSVLRAIPQEGMGREAYRGLLSPLLVSIGDGHTNVYPDGPTDFSGIPLYFLVVEEGLYVAGAMDDEHKSLFGARLESIEGVEFDQLVERTRKYYGADNIYGTLAQLANFEFFLGKRSVLEDLVPEWQDKSLLKASFKLPDGKSEVVRFATRSRVDDRLKGTEKVLELPSTSGREFGWGFLGNDKEIAYLRVARMVQNRETWEKRSTYSDVTDGVEDFYHDIYGEKPTGSLNETMAKLPSLTDTYTDLVRQMKQNSSRVLIVDLRTNIGGWAYPADMLVYFLYGKEALIELHRRTNVVSRKLSPYYFSSEPDQTLEELNEVAGRDGMRDFPLRNSDYDLSDVSRMSEGLLEREYVKRIVEEDLALSKTFYDEYMKGSHAEFFRPEEVLFVTNASTYSAGFMFAMYLDLLGATHVGGVPSQNIAQMGETVDFELKNSKLKGTISHSYLVHNSQIELDDKENLLLTPAHEITYEILRKYNYSRNAPIRYAIDLVQ